MASTLHPSAPTLRHTQRALSAPINRGLRQAMDRLKELGLPQPSLRGSLLRPTVAASLLPRPADEAPLEFWMGAVAVQMVHEASLHHDDVLDHGVERRGAKTLFATGGPGAALLEGDRLLTAGYRAALETRCDRFMDTFIRGVEATVAGEALQAKTAGTLLDRTTHRRICALKTGHLFGVAAALPGSFGSHGSTEELRQFGVELGTLYQMVDDYLDYCVLAPTGKTPYQDFDAAKWTWVLDGAGSDPFGQSMEELRVRLFGPREPESLEPLRDDSPAGSLMAAHRSEIEDKAERLSSTARRLSPRVGEIDELLASWASRVRNACRNEESLVQSTLLPQPASVSDLAKSWGASEEWPKQFRSHSRSFSFASRLFPRNIRSQVTTLYMFCRFTDDLVDEAPNLSPEQNEQRLDEWCDRFANAARTGGSDIPLLDALARDIHAHEVPLRYGEELIEGVRMDLRPTPFSTYSDLEVYTYRVAAVVGGWMTRLLGVSDPSALEGAYALGHGMQLTNIVRDVGEDLNMGRLYVPTDLMETHGVSKDALRLAQAEHQVPQGYRNLLEDMMVRADHHYDLAFKAMPMLPPSARAAIAAAAEIYRGIHGEVRKAGYDNLSQRAVTGRSAKIVLGARGWGRMARTTLGQSAAGAWLATVLKAQPR